MDADRWIRATFPNLAGGGYEVTSADSEDYNCIAWAVLGDTENRWWPNDMDYYWPPQCLFPDTLNSFLCVLWVLSYEACGDGRLENGYEKIVIYRNARGQPTHMARQLGSGKWTSKLGQGWDIKHSNPEDVECAAYGPPVLYFKRPVGIYDDVINP